MKAYQPYGNPQQMKSENFEQIPIGDSFGLDARKKLGSGSFGDIYLGMNLKQKEEVAIKIEPIERKSSKLTYEHLIYEKLEGGGTYINYI